MATRNIKYASFRYSGDVPKCKELHAVGNKIMGIGDNLNKWRDSFVYEQRYLNGIIIRAQKTKNNDRIIYIYVPLIGGCIYDELGVRLYVEGKHWLFNSRTGLFKEYSSVLDEDLKYYYLLTGSYSIQNDIFSGELISDKSEIPAITMAQYKYKSNTRYSRSKYGYGANWADINTYPKYTLKENTDTVNALIETYTSNSFNPDPEEDLFDINSLGLMTSALGNYLITFDNGDIRAFNLGEACYLSDQEIPEASIYTSIDFSTYKTLNTSDTTDAYIADDLEVVQFLVTNRIERNQDTSIVRAAFITRQSIFTSLGDQDYSASSETTGYLWKSTPRQGFRGSIYRVVEISLYKLNNTSERQISAEIINEGDTLIDKTYSVSTAPRLYSSNNSFVYTCAADLSGAPINLYKTVTQNSSSTETINPDPNGTYTYPISVGYYNDEINIVQVEYIVAFGISGSSVYSYLADGQQEYISDDGDPYFDQFNKYDISSSTSKLQTIIQCRVFDSSGDIIPLHYSYKVPSESTIQTEYIHTTNENSHYTNPTTTGSGSNNTVKGLHEINSFLFTEINPSNRVYAYEFSQMHENHIENDSGFNYNEPSSCTTFSSNISNREYTLKYIVNICSTNVFEALKYEYTLQYSASTIDPISCNYFTNPNLNNHRIDITVACEAAENDSGSGSYESSIVQAPIISLLSLSTAYPTEDDYEYLFASVPILEYLEDPVHTTKNVVSLDADIHIRDPLEYYSKYNEGLISNTWPSVTSSNGDSAFIFLTKEYDNNSNYEIKIILNGEEHAFQTIADLANLGIIVTNNITDNTINSIAATLGAF